MIISKEVKLRITGNLTSEYIETELKNSGYNILRWSITNADKEYYTVNISIVTC